jgi:hypothetical protein
MLQETTRVVPRWRPQIAPKEVADRSSSGLIPKLKIEPKTDSRNCWLALEVWIGLV